MHTIFPLAIVGAYLLGSIPFGLLIVKAHGKDLRSIGSGNIGGIVNDIDPLLDHDTLVVVSSDLSHFLHDAVASVKDKETIDMMLALQADKILTSENRACGKKPVAVTCEADPT